ncbi:DeoR/GlpR family DNA-binding transcription regulator [Anaerobranca gottschalkii]|nr:DeoR/GlpR family DNA-binding transcription regulator [Anaerobranca gottschalkii]
MFVEERHRLIIELLKKHQRVRVNTLTEELGVSESTIRRDLQELEEMGLLKRTHGGAVLSGKLAFEPTMGEKAEIMQEEKRQIGILGASLIKDNETIFLDAGTTTLKIAEYISAKNITVLTNSLSIALELSKKPDINLILTGGQLRWQTHALVGPVTEEFIRNFRVDKAFIGTNGISVKEGITTPNVVEAYTKKAMIQIAKEVIVVADHSKFEKDYFVTIAPIEKVDLIITDDKTSQEQIEKFIKAGIGVITG